MTSELASPLLSDLTLQIWFFSGSSTTLNITGTSAGSLENCNFLPEEKKQKEDKRGKRENKRGEEERQKERQFEEGIKGKVNNVKGESWSEQLKLMQITVYGGKQIHLIV